MKKLLLVLGCAVLLAGCTKKPAMEVTTDEGMTGEVTTGAMVEETTTTTDVTTTTTTTDTTTMETTGTVTN